MSVAAVASDDFLTPKDAVPAKDTERHGHNVLTEILKWHQKQGGSFGQLVIIGQTADHPVPTLGCAFAEVISVPSDDGCSPELDDDYENPAAAGETSSNDILPEQTTSSIEPESADMVICFSPLDAGSSSAIEEMARLLQPGGSLAILHKSTRPQICHPAEAKEAFDELMDFVFTTLWTEAQADEDLFQEVLRSFRLSDSRLANIPLPKALFERQARMLWTAERKGARLCRTMLPGLSLAQDRLPSDCVNVVHRDVASCTQTFTSDDFYDLLNNFGVVRDRHRDSHFMEEYRQKLADVGEMVGNDSVVLRWDVTVLLARRSVQRSK